MNTETTPHLTAAGPSSNDQERGAAPWLRLAAALLLAALVLGVFLKVRNYEFVSFDDGIYVAHNAHVAGGLTAANLVWAFTTVDKGTGYWAPVTMLSHMADVQLFGMDPGWHHLTGVLIHTLATLVLLLFLYRLTGAYWRSLCVAAPFALHPLHVESVAWVAERKDVLSALFWFLTLTCYTEYVRKARLSWYLATFSSLALGLMCKPMLVTLPVVMLLLDLWPLDRLAGVERAALPGRLGKLVVEKLPFFGCSLASSAIAIYAQKISGAVISVGTVPLALRLQNALVSYAKYLGLTLWPHDMGVLYPFPLDIPTWQWAGALALLAVLTSAALFGARRFPFLAVGWLWFLITLLPVIGLVQVGTQAYADRFSYLPSVGLFIAAVWGAERLAAERPYRRPLLALAATAAIGAATLVTWQQLEYWEDSFALFRHTIEVTSNNHIMHNNLGVVLEEKGTPEEALREYQEAAILKPDYLEAHYNLGVVLYKLGQLDRAIAEFQLALRINPEYAQARHNLGLALVGKGDLDGAIREYRAALAIKPDFTIVYNKLGIVLAQKGDINGALEQFQRALQIDPGYRDARQNLEHFGRQQQAVQ